MNIVGLMGKISTDIKVKTAGNSRVTSFLLSVRGAGKWGGDVESGYGYGSFSVEAWGKQADVLEKYCEKGTVISLNGSLKQDTWEDNGVFREKVKIVLTSFNFVNSDPEDFVSSNEVEGSDEVVAIDPFV